MSALLRTFEGMLPMQLGVEKETELFLLSCLVGAALGVVYQLVRAARVIVPHFKWAVFAEDTLFGLFAGFCFFLLFTGYELKLRGFVLFGMLLSAALVHFLIGEPFIKMLRAVVGTVKRFVTDPIIGFIAKRAKRAGAQFVQKYKNFKNLSKKDENRLKEQDDLVYNKKVNKLLKG